MKPLAHELEVVQQLTKAKAHQIVFENFGWSSRVYLVNDGEFVIKFPRSEAVKKEYEREIKILQFLEQKKLNLQVPKVRWIHAQNDYLGFEGIIGQPSDRLLELGDASTQQFIGRQVGRFIKELHSFELDGMRTMQVADEMKQFRAQYQSSLDIINMHFSEQEKTKLREFVYRTLPAQLQEFESDIVLCHGDLGYWNIIIKSDGNLGVIDFGDVGYYDRSKDFIGMIDERALNVALHEYSDNEILRKKIVLRKKLFWMPDLKFFSDKNNLEGVSGVVREIKQTLAQ